MQRKDLQVFDFNEQAVRVLMRNGEPWWVAKDVCDSLGLGNSRDAISSLDDDEKDTVGISDGNRGNPNTNLISESGLYSLIMRSNKPEAKKFRKWVTSEVLPTIRKTGKFSLSITPMPLAVEKLEQLLKDAKQDGTPWEGVNQIQAAYIKELVEWSEVERTRNMLIRIGETGEEIGLVYKILL